MNDVGPVSFSRSSVAAGSISGHVNHGEDHTPAPGRASGRVELSDQARRLSTTSQVVEKIESRLSACCHRLTAELR